MKNNKLLYGIVAIVIFFSAYGVLVNWRPYTNHGLCLAVLGCVDR